MDLLLEIGKKETLDYIDAFNKIGFYSSSNKNLQNKEHQRYFPFNVCDIFIWYFC